MTRTGAKSARLLFAVALLFLLGALTVDRRCCCTRMAYRIRKEITTQALLRNRINHLDGSVLTLDTLGALIEQSRKMGIDIGNQKGLVVVAAPPISAESEER